MRWVIIMIVSVFDPLAVLMLVAVNWSLRRRPEDGTFEINHYPGYHQEWVPDSESWPPYEADFPNAEEVDEPPIKEAKQEWSVGEPPDWTGQDDKRADIVGQNGNDGLHYQSTEPSVGVTTTEEEPEVKTIGRFQQDLLEKKLKRQQKDDINSYDSPSKEFNISDPDNTWYR